MSVALAFLGVFLVSTLAVRVVILKVRGGGDAAAVVSTRRLLFVVAGAMLTALVTLAWHRVLPWVPLVAIAPSWIVSIAIAVAPPAPRQLRSIGWTAHVGVGGGHSDSDCEPGRVMVPAPSSRFGR